MENPVVFSNHRGTFFSSHRGTFFSRTITRAHVSIDVSIFAESVRTKRGDGAPPPNYVAYWDKPTCRWVWDCRDGKPEVTDAATLEYEMRRKAEAEAEDAAAGGDAAERLRGFGVMLSFLVAFTYAHDCWDWPSWRVQRDIIKPATRARRCRCLLYTSPSPRDKRQSRMPSSA